MRSNYVGYLRHDDPLYDYLHREIEPQLGVSGNREYRVSRFSSSNSVYLYEDNRSGRRFVGKFYYGDGSRDRGSAHAAMEKEFASLNFMRSFGFSGGLHYIARPLGRNSILNELLLEEGCFGESLSSILDRAVFTHDDTLLFGKLTALAYFLSRFHNLTADAANRVDFRPVVQYARNLAATLRERNYTSDRRNAHLHAELDRWAAWPEMWSDVQVVVHGDATPENFLFGDGLHVISFDLERLRKADRLFDLGRLAAELAHAMMLRRGDRAAAEPFIGHLLWEYSCHFPDRSAAFTSITRRLPFYMGINLLRIARNSYFDWYYRQRLLDAAVECLKGGMK